MNLVKKISEITDEELRLLADELFVIVPESLIDKWGEEGLKQIKDRFITNLMHNRDVFKTWFLQQNQDKYVVAHTLQESV